MTAAIILHLSAAAKTTHTAIANGGDGGTGISVRKLLVYSRAVCIVHNALDVHLLSGFVHA